MWTTTFSKAGARVVTDVCEPKMDGEDSPLVFAIGRVDPLEGATLRVSAFDDVPAFEAAVEREAPDVAVVEHDPPRLNGLSVLESVLAATEGLPSLLWTDPPGR
jgi:hypothetical protein